MHSLFLTSLAFYLTGFLKLLLLAKHSLISISVEVSLKYSEILKTYRGKSLKKCLKELFLAMLQAFRLQLFQKMKIHAGRVQDATFFKKDIF